MRFGREKRLILGLLALLAPVPLAVPQEGSPPVIEAPFFLAYAVTAAAFLVRAYKDPPRWLRPWMLNLLGLAYLPLLLLDLSSFGRGPLLRPMMHLAMFAVVVKMFSLTRERDKWQAYIGIFFLFLASMATSVHAFIVLYLAAFAALSLLLLTQFAFLHVVVSLEDTNANRKRFPVIGFLTVATLATLIGAVPLFAFLPRLRSPYILGRGTGTGTIVHASGFSDEVSLDEIGSIRTSREVVMRLLYEGSPQPQGEMRFKAGTYDSFDGRFWHRAPQYPRPVRPSALGLFVLAGEKPSRKAKVWLRPLNSASLVLPVEAVSVELSARGLRLDRGGAVALTVPPVGTLHYRVGLSSRPQLMGAPPSFADTQESTLDLSGSTPRMAALATRIMGQGPPGDQARRLETYLAREYEYTLDFVGRRAEQPLEDFLFKYRSGHCEYFASAMVLLLRSQGIPARLVTGFVGGEYNPFEGYFVVRQRNAHAWLEAYLPEDGWTIFDPTPQSGRPLSRPPSMGLLLAQAWDYLQFRWDRYVLSYGFYDQVGFLFRLRRAWGSLWRGLLDRQQPGSEAPSPPSELRPEPVPGSWSPRLPVDLLVAILLLIGAWAFFLWHHRPPLTATGAYARLRRRLVRAGFQIPDSMAPLTLRRRAALQFPMAAIPTARVVRLYLRESFGGEGLKDGERDLLRLALRQASRALKGRGLLGTQ